jgi:hypothetical protein
MTIHSQHPDKQAEPYEGGRGQTLRYGSAELTRHRISCRTFFPRDQAPDIAKPFARSAVDRDVNPEEVKNVRKLLILGLVAALVMSMAPVSAWCCEPHTQGYWKNHPDAWPCPMFGVNYEDSFFHSGQDWMEVLQTAPKGGNAYYLLAHQYIAATLNWWQDDCYWAPWDELEEANELLSTYTPAQIAAMKGNDPVRQKFICLADYLDKYNNGLLEE